MIRVAILGGGIGAQHLDAYRSLPQFEVTLLVDQDRDRLQTLATGGIQGATDVAEALASDVDVIDICLPPHLHAPVMLDALTAGKHVICEKPLATSLEQIDEMAKIAKATNRRIFPVFQYRFGPAFDRLTALRDAGLTGTPRAAAVETHWNRGADYYAVPWRGTWQGEQGGAVLGHAIHVHDLIHYLAGPITGVAARLGTLINPIETDDTGALIFDLADGGFATSSITLGAADNETRLRIVYEHLTATSHTVPYAPGRGGWRFDARDPDRQRDVNAVVADTPVRPEGFIGFLNEISLALAGKPNSAVSFDDGAASIELVTAIYAAHRNGGHVTLPLAMDEPLRQGWQP